MASSTEWQSIAPLEAMAGGCALIAADVPKSAASDLARECRLGLTYHRCDFDKAAYTVGELMARPSLLRSAQGQAKCSAVAHDLGTSIRELEKLYESLVATDAQRRKVVVAPRGDERGAGT